MHDEIRDEEEEREDVCHGRPDGAVWCVTITDMHHGETKDLRKGKKEYSLLV